MRLGRKSLLYGCHQFLLHPILVLLAWRRINRLTGGKLTWKHWLAALVHDWGYWWASSIDGPSGLPHPAFGAELILWLTGDEWWYEEILCHSRFYAKRLGLPASNMCWVDKLSVAIMPSWLWATLAWLTGEGWEYIDNKAYEIHCPMPHTFTSLIIKHQKLREWTMTTLKKCYGVEVK